MATANERAVEAIKAIQGDRSINQFARDLGMDPGQLWRVLNGGQSTNGVIIRIISTYPEHAPDIAKALAAPDAAPAEVPA